MLSSLFLEKIYEYSLLILQLYYKVILIVSCIFYMKYWCFKYEQGKRTQMSSKKGENYYEYNNY